MADAAVDGAGALLVDGFLVLLWMVVTKDELVLRTGKTEVKQMGRMGNERQRTYSGKADLIASWHVWVGAVLLCAGFGNYVGSVGVWTTLQGDGIGH